MFSKLRNPYTGRLSAGYRFRFNNRAFSHKALYLPLEMRHQPQIKLLLKGSSPLEAFSCSSLQAARKAFVDLRKQYDFPFWAATEYYVRDFKNAERIVSLVLNCYQHKIADTFLKRYFNREFGRYIIAKTFSKAGVTTCVQAYILWRQIYHFPKNSYTCSASDIAISPLKANFARFLDRMVPSEKFLYVPGTDRRAFFNTFRNPDYIRGLDLAFVHFADMSKWHDSDGGVASRAFYAAVGGVLLSYNSLVVLEGKIPKPDRFDMSKHQKLSIHWERRVMRLALLSNNPFFLDHVAIANIPNSDPYFFPINLNP